MNLRKSADYLALTNLLRGLAAFTVVIWHYQHFYAALQDYDFTRQPLFKALSIPYTRGYEAVPLFWMISGVVLTHRYSFSKTKIRDFAAARIARLYPLHVISLIAVAALQLISDKILGYQLIYGNNSLGYFLKNLIFASFWQRGAGYSFNGPIWSVSIEIPVYVFFGLVVAFSGLRRVPYVTFVAVALFIGTPIVRDSSTLGLRDEFLRCILYFGTGSGLYQLAALIRRRRTTCYVTVGLTLVTFVALRITSIDILILTCSAAVIICLLNEGEMSARLAKPLGWFGNLTYSVFLCHIPVQMVMMLVAGGYNGLHLLADKLWFLFIYMFLTYLVGALAFRYIERPGRILLIRRLTSRAS